VRSFRRDVEHVYCNRHGVGNPVIADDSWVWCSACVRINARVRLQCRGYNGGLDMMEAMSDTIVHSLVDAIVPEAGRERFIRLESTRVATPATLPRRTTAVFRRLGTGPALRRQASRRGADLAVEAGDVTTFSRGLYTGMEAASRSWSRDHERVIPESALVLGDWSNEIGLYFCTCGDQTSPRPSTPRR